MTPTDTPIASVKPTRSPKPSAAAAPNLVIGKFEIDADYVLAETPADAIFTVRNSGTGDAGPFKTAIAETNTDSGVKSTSNPFAVDAGLGAGKSVKVTISISIPKGGDWTLAATADTEDAVAESDETDNASEISVKVLVGLPDLGWQAPGLSITDTHEVGADGHKIELHADIKNTGTDTAFGNFSST